MQHSFVEYIPEDIKEKILYISMDNEIIVHKCCCGCGEKVFLPLSPADWKLTFNGESVSLFPSIGNWGMNCKSHYWVKDNNVIWSSKWDQVQIDLCRKKEEKAHKDFFENKRHSSKQSIWSSFLNWIKDF